MTDLFDYDGDLWCAHCFEALTHDEDFCCLQCGETSVCEADWLTADMLAAKRAEVEAEIEAAKRDGLIR